MSFSPEPLIDWLRWLVLKMLCPDPFKRGKVNVSPVVFIKNA
jgi:hypothetical protein